MRKLLFFVLMAIILGSFTIGCPRPIKPEPEAEKPARPEVSGVPRVKDKGEIVSEPIYPLEVAEAIAPQELSIVELKDVFFDYDKYDIRPDGRVVLDSVAPWLLKNNLVKVLIEGHCDERGTNEYNLALGEKRAKAVQDYLISKGVAPNRISTISYGEEKPICLEHDETCWQRNRRARFVVTK